MSFDNGAIFGASDNDDDEDMSFLQTNDSDSLFNARNGRKTSRAMKRLLKCNLV